MINIQCLPPPDLKETIFKSAGITKDFFHVFEAFLVVIKNWFNWLSILILTYAIKIVFIIYICHLDVSLKVTFKLYRLDLASSMYEIQYLITKSV